MSGLMTFLDQVPVLAALPEASRRHLERVAEQRQYRRRQVIHFPDQSGDFIYLLCAGRVKVSRVSDQGREVTLYLLEGVQLFGETGLTAPNRPYELMAETMDDSQIAVLRRGDVLAALGESQEAWMEMLRLISDRRSTAEGVVADLVFLEVPKRLAKLLLQLCDAQGGRGARGAGTLIKAKYTHQELANMIGSTRETTTLILNDFKRHGYIDFLGRKVVIKDQAELEAIVHRSHPLPP